MQGRAQAVASKVGDQLGKPVSTPQFTATTGGFYGVVIANENPNVGGDYTVEVKIVA